MECAIHYGESHGVIRKKGSIFTICGLRIGHECSDNSSDVMYLDWYMYNSEALSFDSSELIAKTINGEDFSCKKCIKSIEV